MSPEVCTTLCGQSSMTYAFLKAGTQCYCAAALPISNEVPENLCGIPCSGKAGLSCGGIGHVAIYEAKGTYNIPTFTLTIPATVNLGENVSFSVSPLPESDYSIDFGNGQTMRSFKTDMFFAFLTAGTFKVRASAMTSEYGEPVSVSAEAVVEVKVATVSSLVCPSAVETQEEFECTLDVIQSSNADFTLDFFGSIATKSDSVKGMCVMMQMTAVDIAIPYHIVYHTIMYQIIPCQTTCHTIPRHTKQYHTIPYNGIYQSHQTICRKGNHTIMYQNIPCQTTHTTPYHAIQ